MNGHELHTRGLLNTKAAIIAALIGDGWDQAGAESLLTDYVADAAKEAEPERKWQRWTPEEWAVIDEVLDASDGRIPGVTVTRPMAERLGRRHKALLSAFERRITARSAAETDG